MKNLVIVILALISSHFLFGQQKVACIGNSITYGFGSSDIRSYPFQLGKLLGNGWEVKNFGVSGATILKRGDVPYCNQDAWSEAKEFNPNVVIIELGTNDSKMQNWEYKKDFADDYTMIINELKALPAKPFIIICVPLPIFQLGYGIRGGVLKFEVIPLVKDVANRNKVNIVNLFKFFRKRSELFYDGIHPNERGSFEIAKVIHEYMLSYNENIENRSGVN